MNSKDTTTISTLLSDRLVYELVPASFSQMARWDKDTLLSNMQTMLDGMSTPNVSRESLSH